MGPGGAVYALTEPLVLRENLTLCANRMQLLSRADAAAALKLPRHQLRFACEVSVEHVDCLASSTSSHDLLSRLQAFLEAQVTSWSAAVLVAHRTILPPDHVAFINFPCVAEVTRSHHHHGLCPVPRDSL